MTEVSQLSGTAGSASGQAANGVSRDILARDEAHRSGLWEPQVVLVEGEGALVYDADGKQYIDCLAGIAVASVGHGNPRLAQALAEQAERLIVCPQNMGNDTRTEFVDKLFDFLRPPLARVFLSSSGAEANEAALKWARAATGRSRFVAAKKGFSGRTMGVLPLTWEAGYREPFGPFGTPVDFVTFNDEDELRAAVGADTAAVMLEPIQGESGINPATDDYLRLARSLTEEHGALLILDEIQTGVGRTGRFLASERSGVSADIVTLAKGLGGGVPIGATVMTDAVARAMPKGGHGSTFGGNPLAAAAGLAVLRELEERDLMRRAAELGERLRQGLEALGNESIAEVRGAGLLIGLQLTTPAAPVVAALAEAGVLTITGGRDTIRFLPPLVIEREQVDEVVKRVGAVLERLPSAG